MKIFILAGALFLSCVLQMSAQCNGGLDTIQLVAQPSTLIAGQPVVLTAQNDDLPVVATARMKVYVDDVQVPLLNVSSKSISIIIPASHPAGVATVKLCISDGPYGEVGVTIEQSVDTLYKDIDKTDPNPSTQNGKKRDLSGGRRDVRDYPSNTHPSGGHGGSLPCEERHVVDGDFTELQSGHQREWSGITPLIGRFSHMYLDYCPDSSRMYLLNDWLIGKSEYETTCYNRFEFTTGNGREQWIIKVAHDTLNPIFVQLNGLDVTHDSTIVYGGSFGVHPSPSDTTPHTIYEFSIRVTAGLFFLAQGHDPVEYIPTTSVKLDCDNGVYYYGLIAEPLVRSAVFSTSGVEGRQHDRYIPTSGIVGLVVEPFVISGEIKGDTVRYITGYEYIVGSVCNNVTLIDGDFSPGEWETATPAMGMYSDLYAKYCNGTLHILNDWIHATQLPDNATCYNLFELYSGNGAEHWGIWVWQDATRSPTVFRNNVDVSLDTNFVLIGSSSFGTSPRSLEPHTIYEFTIKAMEGGFALQLADPGPASICSDDPSSVNDNSVFNELAPNVYPNPLVSGRREFVVSNVLSTDVITIFDLRGQVVYSTVTTTSTNATIVLPLTIAAGLYNVEITRSGQRMSIPLVVQP